MDGSTTAVPDGAADAAVARRYATRRDKAQMTLAEAEALSRHLARELAARHGPFDLVVGVANGGILPAVMAAETLGLPSGMVQVRRQGSRWIQRLQAVRRALALPSWLLTWGPLKWFWYLFQMRFSRLESVEDSFGIPVAGRRVALIDDCVVSGASLRYVEDRLKAAGAEVRTGVICWSDDARAIDPAKNREPDTWLHREVHFYPWSGASPALPEFKAWLRGRGLELWT